MLLLLCMSGAMAFILTVFGMPYFIRFYHKAKVGGQQMHEDVKQHQAKAGTPTMGGAVFLLAAFVVSFAMLLFNKASLETYGILVILALYGLVGFLDDFLKVFKQINEGLKPKQKLALQILGGLLFYLFDHMDGGVNGINFFGYQINITFVTFIFIMFWLVGFSNAVNLTDGIDGLSSISVVISLAMYSVIAYQQKQFDVMVVCVTMIGALLGFFVYNHKPAKVFMGDVGSLALGGMLAAISMALKQEWTLLLIGLVYVIETSSVMIQVSYYKYTKKKTGEGKRIFRMTPFHHHLELGGLSGKGAEWSEWKVDFFLWSIGLISGLVTLAILYL